MNRIVLNALWATLHFYVGWRLCASLAEWPWLTAIAWAMTSEFTAAFSTIAWSTLATGTAMFVLLSTLVITVLGMWNARRTAAIVKVDVPISGLPAALHGFAIAQISDIHVGPTIKGRYVDAIVNAVNRLNADMVAVTGDLVDGSVEDLAHHVSPLIGDYVLKACERTRLIARHDDTKRHLRQSPRLSLGSLKRTI